MSWSAYTGGGELPAQGVRNFLKPCTTRVSATKTNVANEGLVRCIKGTSPFSIWAEISSTGFLYITELKRNLENHISKDWFRKVKHWNIYYNHWVERTFSLDLHLEQQCSLGAMNNMGVFVLFSLFLQSVWLFLVYFTSKFVQRKNVVKHLTPDRHSHSQSWKQAPTLGLQSWVAARGSQHWVSVTCQALSASLVQSFQMQSVWREYLLVERKCHDCALV